MCRGPVFAAWEAECIRNLMAIEGVEPALLIVDDSPRPRLSFRERLPDLFNPKTLLWRVYQRAALNRRSQASEPVDLSNDIADVPAIRCVPNQSGKFVQRFQPEDVAAIREHDLDFVLRFAFNILKGDVLDCARHGIWSFHHGDPDVYRGTPPGFWEIYRRDPVTGTVLQRLTERLDAGIMLHKGYFKTDPTSYARSRDSILFGAADWPARLCKQIQRGLGVGSEAEASSTAAPIYRSPNSLQMLRFLWISAQAWIANQFQSLFRVQQWSVGIIDAPIEEVAGLAGATIPEGLVRSARWLPEPKGRFLADPFAFSNGDRLTILAEDFDWRTNVGRIAAIEVGEGGKIGQPELAVERSSHLSYPYLLQVGDELLCIPESSEAGDVILYRASDDRRSWAKAATLMEDVPIIDPTLFQHGGKWWLFGTRADAGDNFKLFGWHADDLTGPWRPHSANPLKTDIRSSRPAGPLFVHEGALYRPAQDCSTGYGAAVVVNRILILTPDAFEEEIVSRIAPDAGGRYPTGLHTLCGVDGRTIIDGSRSAFVGAATARALKRKFGRLLPSSR